MAKRKKDSRTLRFNKWMGCGSAVLSGVMSLGDAFGFMKADWTCVILFVFVIVISVVNYRLRLSTKEAVQ